MSFSELRRGGVRRSSRANLAALNAIKPGKDVNGYEYTEGNRKERRGMAARKRRAKVDTVAMIEREQGRIRRQTRLRKHLDAVRARTHARKEVAKGKPSFLTRAQIAFQAALMNRIAEAKRRREKYFSKQKLAV